MVLNFLNRQFNIVKVKIAMKVQPIDVNFCLTTKMPAYLSLDRLNNKLGEFTNLARIKPPS